MVVLGVVPDLNRLDLGGNLMVGVPFLLEMFLGQLGSLQVLLAVGEDGTSVLGAVVWALSIDCCGIVDPEENVQEIVQRHLRRLVRDLERFGEVGGSRTDSFVIHMTHRLISIGITHFSVHEALALKMLSKHFFDTPEASCSHGDQLGGFSCFDGRRNDTHDERKCDEETCLV